MAKLWYSHFDSTAEDRRKILAEDWARYIRGFITDGIRNGGSCLQVSAGTAVMFSDIACGSATIQGYVMELTTDVNGSKYSLLHKPADSVYPRIDRVVLRLSREIQERSIKPCIISGVASSSPQPPALTRNENIWEISLAQVRINQLQTTIAETNITDERFNESVCGLMNSILGLESSEWQEQFDAFMDSIHAQELAFLADHNTQFVNQLSNQQTTSQNQTTQQQVNWQTQTDLQQVNWQSQTETQESDWQSQMTQESNDWHTQYENQSYDFSGFFASVQDSLPQYASFDIANLAAYPGTIHSVVFGTTTITEALVNKFNPAIKLAEQITTFNANGSITSEQTVYKTDGVTVLRRTTQTTVFNPDGSITEEVV